MAKFKIDIFRTEYFRNSVVVEAADLDEAVKKVERAWEEDDYLYEKTTDMLEDADTKFYKAGLAKDIDIKYLINID